MIMEDLVGKKFRYKGSNDFKVVKEVKNNRVFFTDNGSIDLVKIHDNFDLVQESVPNPDTFFDNNINMTSNFGNLLNQIENFKNNPSEFARISESDNQIITEPIIHNGQDVSGLSPETIRWMKEEEEKQRLRVQNKDNINKNDPWMAQFNGSNEVRRIDTNVNQEELDRVTRVNNGEVINDNQPMRGSDKNNNALPKMKKTFKVKLNIEMYEMIPKVDDIRAVENLFDVSIVDELAKEIADKYLNDRELFENMIIAELEKIVKPKPKKRVVKKTDNKNEN